MTADLPPVCGALAALPDCLVGDALALETSLGQASTADVLRGLRCTLQAHHSTAHYGHVLDLDGVNTGSVWTTWAPGQPPEKVTVLPDCPSEDGKPCVEAEGHPGGHTWQTHDPISDLEYALDLTAPHRSPPLRPPVLGGGTAPGAAPGHHGTRGT